MISRPTVLVIGAAAALLLPLGFWLAKSSPTLAPDTAYKPGPFRRLAAPPASPPPRGPTEFNTETSALLELARSGSPAEIDMLLDQLRQETDPRRRQTLRTALSSISNLAAAQHLITRLAEVADEDAILGLERALSVMADESVVRSLAAAYETVPEARAPRITRVVESVLHDAAVPALAALVADPAIPATDELSKAALKALARLGTPYAAATLARRLDSATALEEIEFLGHLLAAVDRAGTQSEITAIAQGKQDATQTHTRLAAMRALSHYPTEETASALRHLASDPDPQVGSLAQSLQAQMRTPAQ